VRRGSRGPQITLSRRTPALLRRLLELEVPEIFNGTVEIKSIAREAGSRSKVAVHATQDGVDPVGSCVGVRGGRIQNVVNELGGEKIDVVQWDAEVGTFIGNALSPARVMNVLLEENPDSGKTATVIVPDRQLSLAIGKEGQNARLAAKLTGWRIDIKSATEAAEETLGRLEDLTIAPEDMDLMRMAEAILQKRESGELTADERQLVEQQVDAGRIDGELELEVGVTQEPVVVSTDDADIAPESEATAETEVTDLEDVSEQVEPAPDGAVLAELAGEAARPEDEAEPTSERELEPVLADDIDDSLGWVVVEPEVDYYSGWEDVEKLEPEPQVEWVREDIDEIVQRRSGKPAKPAKRKKKGGRPRYGRGDRDR
jgi:N utilization substance protein A